MFIVTAKTYEHIFCTLGLRSGEREKWIGTIVFLIKCSNSPHHTKEPIITMLTQDQDRAKLSQVSHTQQASCIALFMNPFGSAFQMPGFEYKRYK